MFPYGSPECFFLFFRQVVIDENEQPVYVVVFSVLLDTFFSIAECFLRGVFVVYVFVQK